MSTKKSTGCGCIARLAKEYHFDLNHSISMNGKHARVVLADRTKRTPMLVATYCPICGKEYDT